jgi:CHAT domain-containing protein
VLAAQRARSHSVPTTKTLAVFADPVFEQSDARLAGKNAVAVSLPPAEGSLLTRSSVGLELRRLTASGVEAEVIAHLVPEDARFIGTGFSANREAVIQQDLSQYRILHFATHGMVDSRYPSLSALALSQFNENGQPINGFLRLHDIYSLKLNADLVVLSACETALGREIRGEGLIGMTQGFMYAGARSLVVSLWQVPDRATAELMARFYDFILKNGVRPAQALAAAQMSIASERQWSDPYFWGAFILLGDWR